MSYPASVATVTVTATFAYSDGSGLIPSGTVTFTPNTVLQDATDSRIIGVKPLTATLDGTGHISVTLMNTSDSHLQPAGWAYTVTEVLAGNQRQYDVFITGATVDLSTLAPVSSTTQFGYVLTTAVGTVGGPAGPLDSGGNIPLNQLGNAPGVGSFVDVSSLGTNVTQGAPHFQQRNEPGSITRLQGQISMAAATYSANTTLATLNAGGLPSVASVFLTRTQGSNTQTLLKISTGGVITNVSAITVASTDTINFDGMTFVHA